MTYYLHSVPGRLRVKIPQLRHRPAVAETISAALAFEGINSVRIKSLTGSVVVEYDKDMISENKVLGAIEASGHFDARRAVSCDTQVQVATSRAAQKCGKALFGWAVGRALEANGLGLLAVFI